MPTYRSISIALHSQFDIETLPEYYLPASSPTTYSYPTTTTSIPPFIEDTTSTCSVHIPVLPGSQFWIAYSVSPPVPKGHYFLFKLHIDGERVMSWSAGKKEKWRGKTMFGLFGVGERRVEKRVFCFSAPDREGCVKDGCIEIRVHRASRMRRIEREVELFEETGLAKNAGGISLVKAGRAGPEQPKRFYKFALIDPVDQPFATFCYYYRTWKQLRDLGLLDNEYYTRSEDNNISVIEPSKGSTSGDTSKDGTGTDTLIYEKPGDFLQVDGDGISIHDWRVEAPKDTTAVTSKRIPRTVSSAPSIDDSLPRKDSIASGTYVPCGAPSLEISTGSPQSPRHRASLDIYRLSMPPSIKLDAPKLASRPPPFPQKHDFLSPTAYRPHPAYPIKEWTVRTPSPVRSMRGGITTPPLEGRKVLGITGSGLMGMIWSTWKRSVGGTQAERKSVADEGLWSVSC